jgi:Flp pilus assembly pilin Flp
MAIKIEVGATYNDKDIKRAQADLNKLGGVAQSQSKSITDSMNALSDGMVKAGSKLTTMVTLPIVGIGAAAFTLAADLQDSMGASEQIFGAAGDSVQDWAKSLPAYFGIAESAALTHVNIMGSMLQNIGGLSEQEAAAQGQALLELAGDLTAMYGGTVESAVQALTGALKGNNSMLDNYGMGINEATIKAKALEMGLTDGTAEMSLQAKQAATLALIMEQTADAQGQAAREAGGASGQMRAFKTDILNLTTEIGSHLLPVGTELIAKLREIFDRFKSLSPETQKTIVKIAGFAAAAGPLLIIGGKLIGILSGITKAMHLLKIAFLTNPIGLIVAAIAGLIALLVVAYFRFEEFREFVDRAWQGIQEAAKEAWEGFLKPIVEQLVTAFQEDILPALQNLWAAFMEAWPGISNVLQEAWGFIGPILAKIIEIYIFLYSIILPALIKYYTFVFTAVVEILLFAWSIIKPILDAIGWVIMNVVVPAALWLWETMKGVWEKVSGAVKAAWDFIGPIFEDLKNGIADVAGWFGEKVDAIGGFFSGIGDTIKDAFRGAFNFVARAWNNTVGKLQIPDWSPIGAGQGMPQIPEFAKGGMVPGIPGEAQLAIVHGGEMILRRSQIDNYAPKMDTQQAAAGDVNVYVTQSDADPYQIGQEILWRMKVAG